MSLTMLWFIEKGILQTKLLAVYHLEPFMNFKYKPCVRLQVLSAHRLTSQRWLSFVLHQTVWLQVRFCRLPLPYLGKRLLALPATTFNIEKQEQLLGPRQQLLPIQNQSQDCLLTRLINFKYKPFVYLIVRTVPLRVLQLWLLVVWRAIWFLVRLQLHPLHFHGKQFLALRVTTFNTDQLELLLGQTPHLHQIQKH